MLRSSVAFGFDVSLKIADRTQIEHQFVANFVNAFLGNVCEWVLNEFRLTRLTEGKPLQSESLQQRGQLGSIPAERITPR
jgi:hypothetical protein